MRLQGDVDQVLRRRTDVFGLGSVEDVCPLRGLWDASQECVRVQMFVSSQEYKDVRGAQKGFM